jgi:2-polyprenyl-6-methoxyphenol hydroxylase-like FAD-dependent oxidoreductase
MPHDVDVLIAGAGPTGLTLGVDLARRGVSLRIVDKAPQPFIGSRGKGLQPRSMEVFDDLGVADRIQALAAPYPLIRIHVGTTVIAEKRMSEIRDPTPDVPYPNLLMIPQWRTEGVLRERLAELGSSVEFGVELTAFERDEEGVTALLGNGESVRATYLVGADGGRGFVRRHLAVPFEGQTYETVRMLVGDVRLDGLDRDYCHVWLDRETQGLRVALWPLFGTDDYQLQASLSTDDESADLSPEAYQSLIREASGRDDITVRELRWSSAFRMNVRMASRFRLGHVFLAGDAAHVHSPVGGQGLNTSVQDAYNLGWKLGQVLAGAPVELLDTYEEERLPVAAGVLGITTTLYRKASEGQAEAHQRGEETQQLNLSYPDSSLSYGPGAGRRAPDGVLVDSSGSRTTLFDLFRGPHFTLLDFAGFESALPRAIRVVRIGDDMDPDGAVRSAYAADNVSVVLVRPDGYIGYHGDPGNLKDYLRRII